MTYILNIETSTKVCSVSVSKNGEDFLLKEIETENYSHAETLTVFISKMIADSAISLTDINAVAVSGGPGSYTGLRIGSATAKGLCYSLDIPLIAIHTLKAMYALVVRDNPEFDCYIPMIDARRMEVYASIFEKDGHEIKEVSADVLEEGIYKDYITEKSCLIFGNGAEKSKVIFPKENIKFIEKSCISARGMNRIAYDKFQNKQFEDIAYFEPNYLKDFIAGKPKKIL